MAKLCDRAAVTGHTCWSSSNFRSASSRAAVAAALALSASASCCSRSKKSRLEDSTSNRRDRSCCTWVCSCGREKEAWEHWRLEKGWLTKERGRMPTIEHVLTCASNMVNERHRPRSPPAAATPTSSTQLKPTARTKCHTTSAHAPHPTHRRQLPLHVIPGRRPPRPRDGGQLRSQCPVVSPQLLDLVHCCCQVVTRLPHTPGQHVHQPGVGWGWGGRRGRHAWVWGWERGWGRAAVGPELLDLTTAAARS